MWREASAWARELVVLVVGPVAWATGGEAGPEPQAVTASADMTSAPAASRHRRLLGSRWGRACCWFMGGRYEKTR